ncbi:MAG: MBL fold metallo-hydrolase [Woeseiaceae bacterium]
MKARILIILALSELIVVGIAGIALADKSAEPKTKVVMLGTGTPNPEPDRSGPAVAIVVNDTPYLVDFGPGVVRRAAAMSPAYGGDIPGLSIKNLKVAFLTHLHSDHTAGLPDLIHIPWIDGRDEPLELYGPDGVADMAFHITKAYEVDIRYRVDGLQPANDFGWRINTHNLDDGVVFEDDNVKVEAFRVRHGTWENAFGFRFTTPDRVIVISGDAAPDKNVEKYASGADILIHEVYSDSGFARRDEFWQKYHSTNHTSASELGQIASRAKPKLLVLYHVLFWGSSEETVLDEVRQHYPGDVVLAQDLDVY